MKDNKVEVKDLIGDIENYPLVIVQRMVDCQVEQGNDANVRVFQIDRFANQKMKGFEWDKTEEGYKFWTEVIAQKCFATFFKKYTFKEKAKPKEQPDPEEQPEPEKEPEHLPELDRFKMVTAKPKEQPEPKEEPEQLPELDRFQKVTAQMAETYKRKNHDYGNSFDRSLDKFGPIAAVVRISDKMNRLESLLSKENLVKDESMKDTLLDMASYCIMTKMWMDRQEESK